MFVMMVSKKETVLIRSFVSEQLCNEPDLSTLTMGILKKRYLAHVKCESLSQEAKKFMKLVVEEELMKIQENDKNGTEVDTEKLQNKRKRGEENEEVESEGENESRAKKSRSNHSSSSESEDADDCKTGSEDEEQIKSPSKVTKQEVKKSPLKRPANRKHQMTSDDSSDDETEKSAKRESESECGDSPKKTVKKKASTPKKGKTRSCDTSGGKQTQESNKDSESDADDCKTGSEDEEQIKFPSKVTKQEVKKSPLKRPASRQMTSDDSSDDETEKSEKRESESEYGDSPKKMVKKKASTPKKGKTRSSDTSGGKQTQESDKDSKSDADDCKTGSEDEEQIKFPSKVTKQEVKKSQLKRPANRKYQMTSDDSSDDETEKSEKRESESECGDSPKKTVKKKASTAKKGKTRSSDTSGGKQTQESDEDSESDAGSKSSRNVKINDSEPSDSEKGKVLSEKNNNDSDSSSLPSLEEEGESPTKNVSKYKKKQKTGRTDKSTRSQKDDDKAIVRLKRYIALCGARRNYKKLLDGCRSVRSKVAVLKKELEDLGVHGNPSIDKCKKVRMKRERAQEVAELDVRNIITTQGRPKRRGTSASQEQHDPPSSAFQRALNSGSDSDLENNSRRGRRKISEWANLHGIISDDADSD
ncbi:HIRA-interacting protein 3 isoform X2 [Melanotaenia boesemani]|uniref:HIRA-interacting protein 3 isoform X2 n=1 Tax=Melanotaenia boesemani TaxID=1250792 RepID=UPI001C053BB9|nr:HIRA-interacting protein 3 isoform X2 [Melanotaenia boesemani]